MVNSFEFASTPTVYFGSGYFDKVGEIASEFGRKVLLVTGGSSLEKSGYYQQLTQQLEEAGMKLLLARVTGEPSPDLVDDIRDRFYQEEPEVVIAVGGGSVMDAGKAISAMLTCKDSVMAYLEGVGAGKQHSGEKIPFIAVPTTSGTGSEATKNAVLSRVGEDGFKKSLRHDNFIPNVALLDPRLTVSCPPDLTAASGMDAISQLLGAYLATEASLLTDSLALQALEQAGKYYFAVCTDRSNDVAARAGMAYASFISGVLLANAGLGIVHGLASPVGGLFDIPHGVVCGTLLPAAVKMNIKLLSNKETVSEGRVDNQFYLQKYARAGALLGGKSDFDSLNITEEETEENCKLLISVLEKWVSQLPITTLGEYGITAEDLGKIAEQTGNKNNPVRLNKEQIIDLLAARL